VELYGGGIVVLIFWEFISGCVGNLEAKDTEGS